MDCVLILLHKPLNAIKVAEDKGVQYYRDSYASAYLMVQDGTFMDVVHNFTEDLLNEEAIELIQPYLENSLFSFEGARKSSAMASSLVHWVKSLDDYYGVVGALNPRRRKLIAKESALAFQKNSLSIVGESSTDLKAQAIGVCKVAFVLLFVSCMHIINTRVHASAITFTRDEISHTL
jgi:hypothetical protein